MSAPTVGLPRDVRGRVRAPSRVARALLAGALAAPGWAAARPAHATTRAEEAAAQTLFDQAKELMARGQYAEACPRFEESERLDSGVGTLLNLADCYEKNGQTVSAWSTFLDAASAAREARQPDREQAALARAASLAPRLPKILVQVAPDARVPGLTVRRDDQAIREAQFNLPIPVDAGTYTIEAAAAGRRSWRERVVVRGESTLTTVTVPPLPEAVAVPSGVAPRSDHPPFGTQRTLALVLGGIGLTGLVAGSAWAIAAKSESDRANAACPAAACANPGAVAESRDAVRDSNLATAAFVASGALFAGSVVLWLTAPAADRREPANAVVGLTVGAGTLRLRGQW